MSRTSSKTHGRNLAAIIIGGLLVGVGLLFSLLFSIIQLISPQNAGNFTGFVGVMAICPLPLMAAGGVLLAIGIIHINRKQNTSEAAITQSAQKVESAPAPASFSEGQNIVVEFERTFDDYVEFSLFHGEHSPALKKQRLFLRAFSGILATALILGIFSLSRLWIEDPAQPLFIAFVYVVGIFCGIVAFVRYPKASRSAIAKSIRKTLAEGNANAMFGKIIIVFSPEGIFAKGELSETKLMWSSIDKTLQDDKYIYMYTTPLNAFVIPKNAFSSEKQQQEFLDYINDQREKARLSSPTAC